MRKSNNWRTFVGRTIHVLVGGVMIFAGTAKLLGVFPPEALEKLGLDGQIRLIGAGEFIAAVFLLVPRTCSLGILLTSAFWGGAICVHMALGEHYIVQSILLLLTWLGA